MIRLAALSFVLLSFALPVTAQDVLQPVERPDWTAPLPDTPLQAPGDGDSSMMPAPDFQAAPQAAQPPTAPTSVIPQGLTSRNQTTDFDPAALDLSEIPDIILKEMDQVQRNCEQNYLYSNFHDCRCIAIKFLDARIKSDPRRSKDAIAGTVQNQCPNEPAIAGFIYHGCTDFMSHSAPDAAEQVCTCAANTVARNYTRTPLANMRYIENLRRDAYIECGLGEAINARNMSPYN